MRILFFVRPHLWKIRGGDTVQIEQTARALRELGVRVEVLSDLRQALDLLRSGQLDAVHLWNLGRPQDAWALLPHVEQVPVVYSTLWVDYAAYDVQRWGGAWVPWELLKALVKGLLGRDRMLPLGILRYGWSGAQREALRRSQQVVTTTEKEAERLQVHFPGLVYPTVVPPGVWPALLGPSFQSNLPERGRTGWLCIGRIEGLKNQAALASAWALLAKRGIQAGPLTFIGEVAPHHRRYGQLFAEKVREARAAGAEIHWIPGGLDAQDLALRYRQAQGVVVPSLFETYGLTALEGLASGCQVVLTTGAESSTTLKPYVTWGHPSPDGLAGAVEKSLRVPHNPAGQSFALTHSWSRAAGTLLPLYEAVVQPLHVSLQGSRGIPNRYGGFEELAEHLALGLTQHGHRVSVYTSSTHPDLAPVWNGVQRKLQWDPEKKLGSASQLIYDGLSLLDAVRHPPDVLLALGTTSSGAWLRLLRGLRLLRKPALLVHLDGLEWKRGKYSPAVRGFLRWQERWAVQAADAVVCDHPALTEYVRKHYPGRARIELSYGVNLPTPADASLLETLGLTPGSYALALSRAVPENNWEPVLEAAEQGAFPLVALADWSTPYGQKIRARFAHVPGIVWMDARFDSEVLEALRQHCRLYFHGHSVGGTNPGLLQAMASGCAVAAHRNPFNHGVLHENAAYFSNANEALSTWEHAEQIPRNHLPLLERDYTWEGVISGYAAAFSRLRAR